MPFQPGHKFSPGGRPGPRNPELDLKTRLGPPAPAALAPLVALLSDEDSQVKLKAATQILDRVYGRPKQVVEAALDATRILDALLARLQGPHSNPLASFDEPPALEADDDD